MNIIGEHVDYNDGFVLPFAINRRTYVEVERDEKFRIISEELGEVVLEDLHKTESWADYVIGVLIMIESIRGKMPPLRIKIYSNLPMGAGLSSSAAIEVATAKAVSEFLSLSLSDDEIFRVSLRAEREFVGVNCGIMDQYTAVYAKKGFALLIDTMKEKHEYVPLNLQSLRFAIIDSGVKHELASGEYNKRWEETARALEMLGKRNYREVKSEDLESIGDENLRKRAKHVVDEIERTLQAAEALKNGDVHRLGELLYQSHYSLSKLYEVSCEETDFIVDFLKKSGMVGARMVGGGFGGGVLVLSSEEEIKEAYERLEKEYKVLFGIVPRLIFIESDSGVRVEDQ